MRFKNKKSLGQNFLIDQNIIKKIVDTGKITKYDKILEIGPGSGNLTKFIIESKPKYIRVVEQDGQKRRAHQKQKPKKEVSRETTATDVLTGVIGEVISKYTTNLQVNYLQLL